MAPAQPAKYAPLQELAEANVKLLESRKGADAIIKCGDFSWHVHSVIVCSRSAFLHQALMGNFKESSDRIVNLKEDDAGLVWRMIVYFYKLDYEDAPLSSEEYDVNYESQLHCNAGMYAIGDKYGTWGLKKLAAQKFETAFCSSMDTDATKAGAALMAVIPAVYSSTPDSDRELRDLAISLTLSTKQVYRSNTSTPDFKSLVTQVPDFAVDLVQRIAPIVCIKYCGNCEKPQLMTPYSVRCTKCSEPCGQFLEDF